MKIVRAIPKRDVLRIYSTEEKAHLNNILGVLFHQQSRWIFFFHMRPSACEVDDKHSRLPWAFITVVAVDLLRKSIGFPLLYEHSLLLGAHDIVCDHILGKVSKGGHHSCTSSNILSAHLVRFDSFPLYQGDLSHSTTP